MRGIIHTLLRFGTLEVFLIALILLNIITLYVYLTQRGMTKVTVIFSTLTLGGIGAFVALCILRIRGRKRRPNMPLVMVALVVTIIPFIHVVHGLTLDRIIRYVEIPFYSSAWPAALDGYRIGFMADMHVISHEDMAVVADNLNDRALDMLLLGGDFSMRDGHYAGTLQEIANIRTTDGIFGVDGNHDNAVRLFRGMIYHGMTPLDNSGIYVRPGFYLAGVADKWRRIPNIERAIESADTDDFILLLSHNPDVVMYQSTQWVDLVLTGHLHGGQITFFGYPIYLLAGSITNYSDNFPPGFSATPDGVPLFNTRGVGVHRRAPRVFARPEVIIFTMHHYHAPQ